MADYVLDTNTFWIKGGNSQHFNIDPFWNDIVLNENNSIYVPMEVIRELEVQYFQFDAQGKNEVREKIENDLVPSLDCLDIPESTWAEHIVRKAASFLCSNYEIDKPQTQLRIDEGKPVQRWWNEYPGVSDARIILTAIYHEHIAVTYNLKDFMLLLALGEKVYNPVDNRLYDPIDSEILTKIHNDPKFQYYKIEIDKFKNTPYEPIPLELQDEDDQI